MNEHVNELLSAFIDQELSDSESIKVNNHLAVCTQCQDEVDELQAMRERISFFYGSIDIPDFQFENAVLNKIRELKPTNLIAYKWIAGGTIIFFAIILSIFLFTFGNALYMGITFASEFIKIGVSLSHAFFSVLSSIPFLLEVFAITTIIIVGLSVWSVRYLLRTKTAE